MKITLIHSMPHGVALLTKDGKIGFESVQEAEQYAKDKNLEIEIRHEHPGGINRANHVSQANGSKS